MTSYSKLISQLYHEGGIKSLYKGYWACFWRDVPTYGAFFFLYDYMNMHLIKDNDSDSTKHMKFVFISALAGTINWVASYPQDLIKSII
jgi:solute carrier family 25 carnitine/acylcarnitine transporter 20/29